MGNAFLLLKLLITWISFQISDEIIPVILLHASYDPFWT